MYKIIKFQGYDRIGFSSLLFRLWEKKKIFRLFKLNLTSFSSLISHFFEDHRIIEHVYFLFEFWLFYLLFWKQLKLLKNEKWSDYRLYERKKELKIHLNRTNSTAKIPCMSPRDEMKLAKNYTRDLWKSKGQLYLIEFYCRSIFILTRFCHLIAIFPQDTKFHHCEDVSVEILCNSMQNRFSILDNIFAFPIVTSIQNEIHQTKIHRKSLITAPPLSLCSNNSSRKKKSLSLACNFSISHTLCY